MEKVILTPREMVLPEVTTSDSEILQSYKDGIASYNERARKTLNVFPDRNGDLAGSNCFAPLELRKYLPNGTKIATMADLGRATEINPRFLSGFYSDTGLTLRTAGDSYGQNDSLAKELARQLEKRDITLKNPKVIYFDALELKEDKDSSYGLAYVLSDKAELGKNIIDAPELVKNYQFKIIGEKGIPIADNEGGKICYTKQDGLSGFCLDRLSGVFSSSRGLAGSYDDGRVVVVRTSEAGSQKILDDFLNEQNAIKEKYIKDMKTLRDRIDSEIKRN